MVLSSISVAECAPRTPSKPSAISVSVIPRRNRYNPSICPVSMAKARLCSRSQISMEDRSMAGSSSFRRACRQRAAAARAPSCFSPRYSGARSRTRRQMEPMGFCFLSAMASTYVRRRCQASSLLCPGSVHRRPEPPASPRCGPGRCWRRSGSGSRRTRPGPEPADRASGDRNRSWGPEARAVRARLPVIRNQSSNGEGGSYGSGMASRSA